MTEAASTLTVVAVGTAKDFERGAGDRGRERARMAAAGVAADQHFAAAGFAGGVDLGAR